jgi:hypothetical protein
VCGTEQQTKNVVLTESFVEKLGWWRIIKKHLQSEHQPKNMNQKNNNLLSRYLSEWRREEVFNFSPLLRIILLLRTRALLRKGFNHNQNLKD